MTPRELVFQALRHEAPSRVPFNARFTGEAETGYRRSAGIDADLADHFAHDIRYVTVKLPPRPAGLARAAWRPVPCGAAAEAAAEQARALRHRGLAVCGSYVCGVYEEAKECIGDAAVLTMAYDDPAGLEALLEPIAEWKMSLYGAYARAGVDIVWIGDDLGAQNALIMSPEHYRRFYRPWHRRIVEHVRGVAPRAFIAFHSCGHVTPLVGDLIDLGVDVLEAVQPEAMDLAELKREYGRDIAFWGGVGNQGVLAWGSPAEVADAVRRTIAVMAPGGGYLLAPCHTITPDVPWANVTAFEAAARAGRGQRE